jgi:hypothetical protein
LERFCGSLGHHIPTEHTMGVAIHDG